MSKPTIEAELEEYYYELHKTAGLVDGGKDSNGEQLWIGTQKQWNNYELMENSDD